MAVKITDSCITCGACIDECPVEAIVDEEDNPENNELYFVYEDKCVECVGHYEVPACAEACPTEECIIWSENPADPAHDKRVAGEDAAILG